MTTLDFANLYNALGSATLFLVAFLLSRRYRRPFFQEWTRTLAVAACLIVSDLVATKLGRPWPASVVEFALIVTATWFFVQTGLSLDAKRLPHRFLGAILLLSLAGFCLALGNGASFFGASAPAVMAYAGAHIWLGVRFMRFHSRSDAPRSGYWLGLPLILSGLWFFSFPVLASAPHGWLGYVVSGILNMLVGTGMVVFLLEETAQGLKESNAALEGVNQLQANFIRMMSHELRTPISTINTSTYLLTTGGDEPLTDRQSELLGIVQDGTDLLKRFVSDVSDFSKMEAGLLQYELAPVDLTNLVATAGRSQGPEFDLKGVRLALETPGAPIHVEGDAARLTQAVINLLVNARKFTEPGGQVTLRLLEGQANAVVEVQDTGIGIAPEEQGRIFEKFYQAGADASRKAAGMGLGLAIAKSIVEDGHQGRLEVRSVLSQGTTFTLTLPRAVESKYGRTQDAPIEGSVVPAR